MSTPDNMFETLPAEALVTATGGVTKDGNLQVRDLRKLNHLISNTAQTQQSNTSSQATTMALMAVLAMRR